jgi:hypothetical protein
MIVSNSACEATNEAMACVESGQRRRYGLGQRCGGRGGRFQRVHRHFRD